MFDCLCLKAAHNKTKTLDTLEFRKELLATEQVLKSFARRLTMNKERADDLVQETILKALWNSDKYTPHTNMERWVCSIMYNTFVNDINKKMNEEKAIKHQMQAYKNNHEAWTWSTYIDTSYDSKEIYKVICSLPEGQRKPMEMHLQGFKYSEIAEHLSISIGTVKSQIFISRKKLQELLRDFKD